MPGSYGHLFRRFFDFTLSKPLTDGEVAEIEGWLTAPEASAFFEQDHRDQAHGYAAASLVRERGHADEVIVSALLHDIGKRHARLGAIGRSVASILIKFRLPLTQRMKSYRDHGALAARELEGLGRSGLVVDFARSHHEERPSDIDETIWEDLQAADNPAKTIIPSTRR